MQVHAEFIIINISRIKLILMLGDDILIFCNATLNVSGLKNRISEYFNMKAISITRDRFGSFC